MTDRAYPDTNFLRKLRVNELKGHDEKSVSDTTTANALIILGCAVSYHDAEDFRMDMLTPWERDQLLARLYQKTYGNNISSTVRCKSCSEKFDLEFNLGVLAAQCQPEAMPAWLSQFDHSTYELLKTGTRFRLPNGGDECAVAHLDMDHAKQALIEACLCDVEFAALDDMDLINIQDAMKLLSPVIDLNLDAVCAECHEPQQVRFSIQEYLLSSLLQDKENLYLEIHLLASFYGWSLTEILDLTRTERKKFAAMIDAN